MATILSKTFDVQHGAVVLNVKDALGSVSIHTIYVLGPGGTADVDAAIASILVGVDTAAAAIQTAFTAAGWQSGNQAS